MSKEIKKVELPFNWELPFSENLEHFLHECMENINFEEQEESQSEMYSTLLRLTESFNRFMD